MVILSHWMTVQRRVCGSITAGQGSQSHFGFAPNKDLSAVQVLRRCQIMSDFEVQKGRRGSVQEMQPAGSLRKRVAAPSQTTKVSSSTVRSKRCGIGGHLVSSAGDRRGKTSVDMIACLAILWRLIGLEYELCRYSN